MIQTLKHIIDVYGLDILKDGNKLLAYYSDLSPKQQRERQMLEYLVKCNGHVILLNALYDTTDEQMRKKKLLVERMVAQVLVSDDIAETVCQNFWKAIGGTPIVLKQPKTVPTSYNSKNLQGDERENATPLRKRVLQVIDGGSTIESIVDRGFMSLEDGAFDEAKKHFDRVLNVHPQCADAYLGLFMAEIKARNKSQAGKIFADGDLTGNRFYQRAKQFADASLKAELESWEKQRNNRLFREVEAREEAMKTKQAAEKAAQEAREVSEKVVEKARQSRMHELRKKYSQCQFVVNAGGHHTVGLNTDGTVVSTVANILGGSPYNVSSWRNIVAVSAGGHHTVGLKADGTVVATGNNDNGECDVSNWRDIVAISAGHYHTVALKAGGTVVATGNNDDGECDVSGWTDIIAVSAGCFYTVGLKADGRIVATGSNMVRQYDVSWRDVVAVSAGYQHTVGLKADGTVVAAEGNNRSGQCNVFGWSDIVAVSAGNWHTVGLKADGTVVATGSNIDRQCDVSNWTDIVAVSAGEEHTVGLKADGTVVATGIYWSDVVAWKLCKNPLNFAKEAIQIRQNRLTAAQNELAGLHGLFTGKRRKELQQEIAELEINIRKQKERFRKA